MIIPLVLSIILKQERKETPTVENEWVITVFIVNVKIQKQSIKTEVSSKFLFYLHLKRERVIQKG